MNNNKLRAVYFTGGPANLISAHQSWKRGLHEPTEVSITFSSQIQQACLDASVPLLMISIKAPVESMEDGLFTIEHRNKKTYEGVKFHLYNLKYATNLLISSLKFRADIAFVDSGATHFFY